MARNHTILLVEDNDDHAELVKDSAPEGDRVFRVTDGDEALDYLFQQNSFSSETAPRPEVIILDLRLKRVDGLDVLTRLKKSPDAQSRGLHLIPVVVLTSSGDKRDVAAAWGNYVNGYLIKPMRDDTSWDEVLHEIDRYWLELKDKGIQITSNE